MKLVVGKEGARDSLFMDFYCIAGKEANSPPVTLGGGHMCCLEQLPSDICGKTVFLLSFHKNVLTAYSMPHYCVYFVMELVLIWNDLTCFPVHCLSSHVRL